MFFNSILVLINLNQYLIIINGFLKIYYYI